MILGQLAAISYLTSSQYKYKKQMFKSRRDPQRGLPLFSVLGCENCPCKRDEISTLFSFSANNAIRANIPFPTPRRGLGFQLCTGTASVGPGRVATCQGPASSSPSGQERWDNLNHFEARTETHLHSQVP